LDIATVSERLRHKSIQTTWDYVGADQKRADDCRNWEQDALMRSDLTSEIAGLREVIAQLLADRGAPAPPALAEVEIWRPPARGRAA
jgi:hypothetical protein